MDVVSKMVEQVKTKTEPHVRFRGFDDEWEQVKLSSVVTILDGDRGKNYPSGDDFSGEGHTLFLNANNVTKDGFLFEKNQYITEDKSNALGNGKLVSNDIVITSRGSLGHIVWYNSAVEAIVPYARINSGMLILRSNKGVKANFISQYLKSPLGKRQIKFLSFGSAQPQLTKADVSNYRIPMTKREEQQKIGELFQTLDKAVDLSNTQVENLKQQKKALLQRLFPQKGETEPKVRLRGFTDAWEEVKLGDLVDTSTGKLNANAMTDDGTYPFFTCAKDVYLTDTYSFDDEALIIAGNGDMGAVKYYNGKFDAYQRTYVLTEIKGDAKYLEYCLSVNLPRQIHLMTYGSTMPYITKSTLTDMAIRIPSLEEQQAIGELFQTLDEQIRLAEDKVSQYKELKQALLQRLFV